MDWLSARNTQENIVLKYLFIPTRTATEEALWKCGQTETDNKSRCIKLANQQIVWCWVMTCCCVWRRNTIICWRRRSTRFRRNWRRREWRGYSCRRTSVYRRAPARQLVLNLDHKHCRVSVRDDEAAVLLLTSSRCDVDLGHDVSDVISVWCRSGPRREWRHLGVM